MRALSLTIALIGVWLLADYLWNAVRNFRYRKMERADARIVESRLVPKTFDRGTTVEEGNGRWEVVAEFWANGQRRRKKFKFRESHGEVTEGSSMQVCYEKKTGYCILAKEADWVREKQENKQPAVFGLGLLFLAAVLYWLPRLLSPWISGFTEKLYTRENKGIWDGIWEGIDILLGAAGLGLVVFLAIGAGISEIQGLIAFRKWKREPQVERLEGTCIGYRYECIDESSSYYPRFTYEENGLTVKMEGEEGLMNRPYRPGQCVSLYRDRRTGKIRPEKKISVGFLLLLWGTGILCGAALLWTVVSLF